MSAVQRTPDLASLPGVRFLSASEPAEQPPLDMAFIKPASGGAPMVAHVFSLRDGCSSARWSIHFNGCLGELNRQLRELGAVELECDGQALGCECQGEAGRPVRQVTLSAFHAADWEEGGIVSVYFSRSREDGRRRLCCGHVVEQDADGAVLFGRCPDCDLPGVDLNRRLLAICHAHNSHFSLRVESPTGTATKAGRGSTASGDGEGR